MKLKLAPSILSADFSRLGEDIKRIEDSGADYVHIDVMDGHFVPNITIGPLVVQSIRKITDLTFDVHLMINHPERYIESFVNAGADIITVHAEACPHLHRVVHMIKERGIRAGVSLNPATSLHTLDYILTEVDMVLMMTVNPGFGGQQYIKSMKEKVHELRNKLSKMDLNMDIEVDGGIGIQNVREITEAGANVIVAGSAFFNAPDSSEFIIQMRKNAAF